ncbi:MAG: M23 family metallopeptidase [Agathobacter sp.]|nr:M23 family metallopeptidase [Agathobacter sp.]
MKKQYIAAMACLVAGAIGFIGIYSLEKNSEKENQIVQQEVAKAPEVKVTETAKVIKPKIKDLLPETTEAAEDKEEEKDQENTEKKKDKEETKETSATVDTLHFSAKEKTVWPIKGKVVLPYSMDKTVYFSTLDQYQYNPAMLIGGNVNDKVYFIADGTITRIYNNSQTGCTVEQSLGDGYTATYGMLKDLPFKKGAKVEGGQVVGYVSEPTKYYSTEGSGVYFSLKKDGSPVNPTDFLK